MRVINNLVPKLLGVKGVVYPCVRVDRVKEKTRSGIDDIEDNELMIMYHVVEETGSTLNAGHFLPLSNILWTP